MSTQHCQDNTATASLPVLHTTSVTLSAGSLPASQRITAGKREAEQRLQDAVLAHLDDLYTYARFLLLEPADAEDAVHECFLKALVNIRDYREATAKLWLIGILRTLCVREILQRGDFAVGDAGDPTACATQVCANDRNADEPSKLPSLHVDAAVQPLIATLPLPLREAIVLRECINLSCREIAAVTGASVSVVNERLAGARTMLLDRGALSRCPAS